MIEFRKFTDNEKFASHLTDAQGTLFNMNENNHIEKILENERARKFNDELDKIAEKFENASDKLKENAEAFADSISKVEIKPMGARLLIKPLKQNPFQKIQIENGIIVDAGGYQPHTEFNERTGKYEEQEEFIKVGVVQEIGPDVKYIRPEDVVFYRKDSVLPVPFFKHGWVTLGESNILAIVNERLEERFNTIKNG